MYLIRFPNFSARKLFNLNRKLIEYVSDFVDFLSTDDAVVSAVEVKGFNADMLHAFVESRYESLQTSYDILGRSNKQIS